MPTKTFLKSLDSLNNRSKTAGLILHKCLDELNGIFRYPPGRPHECLEGLNAISAGGAGPENNRSIPGNKFE